MLNEPLDMETIGYPGYLIFSDGRIYSTNTRGKNRFKNLDYTGCALLKHIDGRYHRVSAKVLAFKMYEVPRLLSEGYVYVHNNEYLVNQCGAVFSVLSGKMLQWCKNRDYWCVRLGTDFYFVHQLVAKTFIPNPRGCTEVDHIDGNKSNNCVYNLRWVTRSENMKAAYASGALDSSLTKANAARGVTWAAPYRFT